MQRRKVDSKTERQLLVALVWSKAVLAGAVLLLEPELFPARPAQLVAEWCGAYYGQYREPLGDGLRGVCAAWRERDKPEPEEADATTDFVEELLDLPTPEHPPAYLLDELSKFLTGRRVEKLRDLLDGSLAGGQHEEAVQAIQDFRTVSVGDAIGYAPMLGRGAIDEAFASPADSLIDFPTEAEWFFGNAFSQDSLIGIQAPEKRGKTWMLFEFADRAVASRRRVAFFQCGDLSKAQLTKRWAVRIAGVPLWSSQCSGSFSLPTKIDVVTIGGKKQANISHGPPLHFPTRIDAGIANRARLKYMRRHNIDADRPTLMFSVHANSTINVKGIDAILGRWRQELDFVPDVTIIDYPDILAPEDARKDERAQINETWKALRRLSQERHTCLIVPTQSNAATYKLGSKVQRMENFSNDKRKLAHVTGLLGLNQSDAEKEQGVLRLNWIVAREQEYHVAHQLWCATCLPLGLAMVKVARG